MHQIYKMNMYIEERLVKSLPNSGENKLALVDIQDVTDPINLIIGAWSLKNKLAVSIGKIHVKFHYRSRERTAKSSRQKRVTTESKNRLANVVSEVSFMSHRHFQFPLE